MQKTFSIKSYFIVLFALVLCACGPADPPGTLVMNEQALFQLYAPVCEAYLEKKDSCAEKNCFTAFAIEVTGIDTAKLDSVQVYAWCWKQNFKTKNGIPFTTDGEIKPCKIIASLNGRDIKVLNVWFPDGEESIKKQIREQAFPEILEDKYFLGQSSENESIRTQSLEKKALLKYKMLLEGAYKP